MERKRLKGALTLEACVSLTAFIFAMLTLSYMIQTYYIYNAIDSATAEVIEDMATKVYFLDQLGLVDAYDTVKNNNAETKEKFDKIVNNIQSTANTGSSVSENIFSFSEEVSDIGGAKGFLAKIMAIVEARGKIIEKIKTISSQMNDISDMSSQIFLDSKELASKPSKLAQFALTSAGESAVEYMLSKYVIYKIEDSLGGNIDSYRIRELDVNFGDNHLLYDAGGMDKLITINVEYSIGVPLFFAPEAKLDKKIKKTVRAWVGD